MISSCVTVARVAIAIAAAMAVMLGAAAAARADATQTISFSGHLRGEAAFFDDVDGETFRICDRYKDNLPVVVRFSYIRKNGTRQTGAHWHTAGVDGRGTPDSGGYRQQGCSYGLHDFGEGRRVWFQACVKQPEEGTVTCGRTEVTGTGPK